MKVKLNDGEYYCKVCNGTGCHTDFIHQCLTCKGTGKLDWISNIMKKPGPLFKPGFYVNDEQIKDRITHMLQKNKVHQYRKVSKYLNTLENVGVICSTSIDLITTGEIKICNIYLTNPKTLEEIKFTVYFE